MASILHGALKPGTKAGTDVRVTVDLSIRMASLTGTLPTATVSRKT
jgi:hypothetical protein